MEKKQVAFYESSSIVIIILFALLGKVLYDFKILGGFNYPLLLKIIHLICIIFAIIVFFHSGELKDVVKQTKLDEYFRKTFK